MKNIKTSSYKAATSILTIDFYKTFHQKAYKPGLERVVTNITARSGKLSNVPNSTGVVWFGLQAYLKEYVLGHWQEFFNAPKDEVISAYKAIVEGGLGKEICTKHLEDLHDLQYLPLEFKTLPEGKHVPYGVPMLAVENTHNDFGWLPNYIETQLSATLWGPLTSATTAKAYHDVFTKYAQKTGLDEGFVPFQGHDFSSRGMMGISGMESGLGHLTSFSGTDNINAILASIKYYNADPTKELVGASVDATEHSVMCSWGQSDEVELFKHLLTESSPKGVLAVVSDTWDFWKVVTEYLPKLKDTIEARDGTLVIRPDSGCPVRILCGYTDDEAKEHNITEDHVKKGLIECLWDTFGGTLTSTGHKLLSDKIGAIYGDSITLERQSEILNRLDEKGFASKLVLGIGSYTYQYVTRDTHGTAMKATNITIDGEDIAIFKDPKTDDGTKKSLKGLFVIEKDVDGQYTVRDQVSRDEYNSGEMETVFKDGKFTALELTLQDVRKNVLSNG